MKTLAVIKNELFPDYLRFVSTTDLPSVLDNPDIPVPFTSVASVDNSNSDILMEQLKTYFSRSKINNKEFYTFDDDTYPQLQFMFNLIKLSSGQTTQLNNENNHHSLSEQKPHIANNVPLHAVDKKDTVAVVNSSVVNSLDVNSPVITQTVIDPVEKNLSTEINKNTEVQEPIVMNTVTTSDNDNEVVISHEAEKSDALHDLNTSVQSNDITQSDDPFGFNVNHDYHDISTVQQVSTPVVDNTVNNTVEQTSTDSHDQLDNEKTLQDLDNKNDSQAITVATPVIEMISALGIPKNSTIHFLKDENITATLLDEKTVSYDNQQMTLVEAAKAAFKKSGTAGMAVGLSNWNFENETLKSWKEKQLN